MTAAQVIALNPTAFKETLERRVAELSDLLHNPDDGAGDLAERVATPTRRAQVITRGQGRAHDAGDTHDSRGVGLSWLRTRKPIARFNDSDVSHVDATKPS